MNMWNLFLAYKYPLVTLSQEIATEMKYLGQQETGTARFPGQGIRTVFGEKLP